VPAFLVTDDVTNNNVVLGELYAGGQSGYANSGDTAQFDYLQHASTTFGVAVGVTDSVDETTWSINGSASVTNNSTAYYNSPQIGPTWGHQMLGQFQFAHQHAYFSYPTCPSYYRVIPLDWTGQVSYGTDVSANAGTGPYDTAVSKEYAIFEPAGSSFGRTSGQGYEFSAGVNVGPISVSSETDYSTQVTYVWYFNRGTSWNLFGTNGPPSTAAIVYSSINVSVG
jgi:hypothetical protein